MAHHHGPWTGGLGPHPAQGDRLGRFRLAEQVGVGGLATVFRAVDEAGADVAVKVLNPARVLPEEVKRFTREYKALSRMNHENIVRVFEAGVHDGYPWIAMEFVDGTDLDSEIGRWRAEDPGDRWSRVDRILRGLCRGLAYVHDQGLIHRDLKPSNVLLTRGGDPKISDFGVVKGDNTQTTQLTMAGRLVGTVAFMAPELITDEGVDRRADLYALGAVLYLMCTYRRPIEADSVAGYLARHLTEVPKPVGAVEPGVPAVLERICARLLQKDRAYRYPSAQAVVTALDRPEDPDSPPLRGRDEALGIVNRLLVAVHEGTGGTLVVLGPSGAGRTHLLRAVRDQAVHHGLATAWAHGGPRLGDVLAEQLDLPDAEALAARGGAVPTVLLVDDLDAAGPEAAEALAKVMRQRVGHDGRPLLLVFTVTDPDADLAGLTNDGGGGLLEVIELGAVDPKAVVAMLRDRGATGPIAPMLARRLHADYRGLPGPMMQQVEALVQEGWLQRVGDVLRPARPLDDLRRADLPVPIEVRSRIADELDALAPAARAMCEVLAVLDRPASPGLLERCRPDDTDAAKRIDQLVKQRVLLRNTDGGEEEVRLADPCTARVVRASLPEDRLRELHAAVAEALGARKRRTHALEVARHLRAAGDAGAAYPLYVQAARRAAREARYGEVLDVCDAAASVRADGEAALSPEDRLRAGCWLDLLRGEALLARRAWDDAVAPLERAAAAAQGEPELGPRTLGALGRAHYRAGRYPEAEPLLRESLRLAAPGSPDRGGAMRALADMALRAGRLDDAERLLTETLFASTDAGSRDGEARARRGLAHLRAIQGRLRESLELLGQADDLLAPDGDYRVRAGIMARAIELEMAAGRLGSALYRAEALVELARRHGMGERLPEAYALLGDLLLRLGDFDEAEDAAHQALVFAKATDSAGWDPRLRAARVLADLGRVHDGFAALPPAEDVGPSPVDDPPAQFAAVSARLFVGSEPARARDLATWALTRPAPMLSLTGVRIAQDAGLAMLELGQPDAARAAFKRGLKLLGAADAIEGADGLRLELMVEMNRAAPDARVSEGIRQVVERMMPALPAHAAERFRARPGIREALGAR